MLKALALLLVAASLYYWLLVLHRGAWKDVVRFVLSLVCVVIMMATVYLHRIALFLALWGVFRLDLSAVAAALVLSAAVPFLRYLDDEFGPSRLSSWMNEYFGDDDESQS